MFAPTRTSGAGSEDAEGIRMSKGGTRSGGRSFSRGALYKLLSNPVYIGEIRHRKERHPGQHEPIVDRELWETTQRQLCDHAAHRRESRLAPFLVRSLGSSSMKTVNSCTSLVLRKASGGIATTSPGN